MTGPGFSPGWALLSSARGKATYTSSSVTEQYNLVPVFLPSFLLGETYQLRLIASTSAQTLPAKQLFTVSVFVRNIFVTDISGVG